MKTWLRCPAGRLMGCEIDVSGIPDLLPVLAVVGAVSDGTTALINAARLRIKESDRLNTVTKMLCSLGAELDEREDALIIHGKPGLNGGTTDSFGDHRIAMAAAVASIACENTVTIQNAQAVDKSYPSFFDDFNALGGNIDVI